MPRPSRPPRISYLLVLMTLGAVRAPQSRS